MDLTKLNWLYYIGCLSKKFEKEYDKKDWTKWINYNLKFDFMWGTQTLTCNKEFYEIFNEGIYYIIKVWAFTSEKLNFSKIVVLQKWAEVYEISWNWVLELTN